MIKTLDQLIDALNKEKTEHGGDILVGLDDPDTGDFIYFEHTRKFDLQTGEPIILLCCRYSVESDIIADVTGWTP